MIFLKNKRIFDRLSNFLNIIFRNYAFADECPSKHCEEYNEPGDDVPEHCVELHKEKQCDDSCVRSAKFEKHTIYIYIYI